MTDQEIICPDCGSGTQKYGRTSSGDQRYRCVKEGCRRQFVPGADHLVAADVKALVTGMIKADVDPPKIYSAVNDDPDPDNEKISMRWIYELKRRMKAQNDR